MTYLDDAMLEQIAYIVISEGRAFSFKDLLRFEIDGKVYGMTHGTFRNKIRKLKLAGIVELDYNSGIAFYTLKGHRHRNRVTPNHTVVHNNPIYKMLQDLPFDKQSIHDIRLKFRLSGFWKICSVNPDFHKNARSQDLAIPTWSKNSTMIRTIIHKTDTVSVTIGCSLEPIPLEINGIIRFFNLLVRIEERLQMILNKSTPVNFEKNNPIPEYKSWVVTMWHFGRDALTEYVGQGISITIEDLKSVLTRLYPKEINGKKRLRIENRNILISQ